MDDNKNYISDLIGSHISLRTYIVGLVLSLVLTLLPYFMLLDRGLPEEILILGIILFALFQLLVQSVCFLHLNASSEGKWNLATFLFTVMVVVILVVGSLWIMAHLDYNMMHTMPKS